MWWRQKSDESAPADIELFDSSAPSTGPQQSRDIL